MTFYNYPTRVVNEVKQDGQINELTLVDYKGKSYVVASAHYAYLGASCGSYTELRIYRDEDDYCPSIGQEWINKPQDAFQDRYLFTGSTTAWGNTKPTVAVLAEGVSLQDWWGKNMKYIGGSSPSNQPMYNYAA
jgi:hypothetical protein